MYGKLVASDFLKIKRKGLWFLAILGPIGVVALQMVNYSVRGDYLFQQSDDRWGLFIQNVLIFTPLALVLGIAILTSFMASIENETNAWKNVMALPVSKKLVYFSKFTVLAFLLLVSTMLLMVLTLLYGLTLPLGSDIPFWLLWKFSFYPYFAALPVLALQLWIATVSQNQGLPITTGIVGVLFTYMAYFLPDWLIWKWPTLDNAWNEPVLNAILGVGVGILLYVAGMFDFSRRDVK